MTYKVHIPGTVANLLNQFLSQRGIGGNPVQSGEYRSDRGVGGIIARLIYDKSGKYPDPQIIGLAVDKALESGCTYTRISEESTPPTIPSNHDQRRLTRPKEGQQLSFDLKHEPVIPDNDETYFFNPDGTKRRKRRKAR